MKSIFLLLATFAVTGLFAQNKEIYGKFIKNDGARIKGTSTRKLFEDQVIITGYTGGSDNSATIEIEVSTGTYVAEFRNMMNAAGTPGQTIVPNTKPSIAPTALKKDIGINKTPIVQMQQVQPKITSAELSVVDNRPGQSPQYQIASKIVLQDIKVESCTDDLTSGKTKIKLKASRIGWIYYTYNIKGAMTSSKSGWDTVAGQAWNNF